MQTLAWRTDSDGFAFENTWALDDTERSVLSGLTPSVVAPTVAAVLGPLVLDPITLTALTATLTLAAQGYLQLGTLPGIGLCGGMTYLSLDYWLARTAPPRGAHDSDQPNRAGGAVPSQVRDLIWIRLLDSLQSGGVLQRTLEWSLLLNQLPKELGGGAQRLLANTKNEWNVLKARINSGQPCPIGLVYFKRDVWDQHQILAYGYEDHGNGTATMQVYDCNKPRQFGEIDHSIDHSLVELDFRGEALVATTPSDWPDSKLAGFFCSDYQFLSPPANLAAPYGQFVGFSDDPQPFMSAYGALLPVANQSELEAIGTVEAMVRPTRKPVPSPEERRTVRPRDGALLRERSSPSVFLCAGGAPFHVPDPIWLERFGGWGAVRVVPDGSLSAFVGPPEDGTLLREWSDTKVFVVENGTRRWIRTDDGLARRGGPLTVRVLPDGAITNIPEGEAIPPIQSPLVPSVLGLTRSDAKQIIEEAGFHTSFTGSTKPSAEAVEQEPTGDSVAVQGTRIRVRFAFVDPRL
ncbi:MAG: PASTA domain-containing protein [Nitrospira sp.]|nr:PASTA domain-containing protein [Nitrospira sp.]